jgi:hypothetical protein
MPRLDVDSPLIENLPTDLAIGLPDVAQIVADMGSVPGVQKVITQDVAYISGQIYQSAVQIGAGQIVSKIGVNALSTYNAITGALGEDVNEVMDEQLIGQAGNLISAIGSMSDSNDILQEALEVGMGLAINLMCTIPVVGWIAKLAWSIGKGIAAIAQVVKQSNTYDQVIEYPATNFNPEVDRLVLNQEVLRRLRTSKDWTQLYRPPGGGKGEGQQWKDEFYTSRLQGGGRRVVAGNECSSCLGFVPGTGFLHKSIEIFGSSNLKDTGNVYLPSSRQHGLWIWKHIARANTPALYTVNAEALASTWRWYLGPLREYILDDRFELSFAQRKKILSYYDRGGDASGDPLKIFGWGSLNDNISPDDYQPVKESRILKKRQLAFLDTLTCAYVGDDYGAMQDAEVKEKWERRRKDLLQHPAICDVDLSMIPDAIYRGQVEYEQDLRKAQCKIVGGNGKLTSVLPSDIPTGQDGAAGIDGVSSGGPAGFPWEVVLSMVFPPAGAYYRDEIRAYLGRNR